ncbi:hypothetical protein AMS68_007242 [Peltaster fructicola]|uniref:Uncharacterized protein n=1 Tax=Peltaster fructicola TaxID=286661 RepID=A0A6H0Y472_9PEZI|nr:hypothetical protein AMS68_007242 [Peltaster fructicola]
MAPIKLLTVNDTPARAKALVERVIADLGDKHELALVGNVEDPKDVKKSVEELKPDVIFTASMWTEEQAKQAVADAKSVKPDIKHLSLPYGLQKEKGPDGVVAYIKEHLPAVLNG